MKMRNDTAGNDVNLFNLTLLEYVRATRTVLDLLEVTEKSVTAIVKRLNGVEGSVKLKFINKGGKLPYVEET